MLFQFIILNKTIRFLLFLSNSLLIYKKNKIEKRIAKMFDSFFHDVLSNYKSTVVNILNSPNDIPTKIAVNVSYDINHKLYFEYDYDLNTQRLEIINLILPSLKQATFLTNNMKTLDEIYNTSLKKMILIS